MRDVKPVVVLALAQEPIVKRVRSAAVVDKLTTIKASSHLQVRVQVAAVLEASLKLHVEHVAEPE
jgi:hypothetical protein